jgi:hypothetical protein
MKAVGTLVGEIEGSLLRSLKNLNLIRKLICTLAYNASLRNTTWPKTSCA